MEVCESPLYEATRVRFTTQNCLSRADGGPAASSFLARKFHVALAKNPLLRSDPKAALLDVWKSMDNEIYHLLAQVCAYVHTGIGTPYYIHTVQIVLLYFYMQSRDNWHTRSRVYLSSVYQLVCTPGLMLLAQGSRSSGVRWENLKHSNS